MNTVILYGIFCFAGAETPTCLSIALAPFKTEQACEAGAWDAINGTIRAIPTKPLSAAYACKDIGKKA